MDKGWIKLHRSILAWEWYDDLNTFRLFMHLLLTVNFEPKKWRGIDVNRGQIITSNAHLADQTGLTVQQIRTAIKKLISTNEITTKATNKNTLVTLVNYEAYQSKEELATSKTTSQPTNKQQSSNNQVTTTKELKKERKRSVFNPPQENQVQELFLSVGHFQDDGAEARRFIDYYAQQNWKLSNGNKMADWKAAGRNWLRNQSKWGSKN